MHPSRSEWSGQGRAERLLICSCLRVSLRYARRQCVLDRDLGVILDTPLVHRLANGAVVNQPGRGECHAPRHLRIEPPSRRPSARSRRPSGRSRRPSGRRGSIEPPSRRPSGRQGSIEPPSRRPSGRKDSIEPPSRRPSGRSRRPPGQRLRVRVRRGGVRPGRAGRYQPRSMACTSARAPSRVGSSTSARFTSVSARLGSPCTRAISPMYW